MITRIHSGRILDPYTQTDTVGEIWIQDDKIIDGAGQTADQEINAQGLTILPGLIDAHVHLRDPGFEYKEDIISGTRAAARGGFTAVAAMPNTFPVTDTAALVDYARKKADEKGYCTVLPIGAVSKGQQGRELAEIGLMAEAGAVAFSDDGIPVSSASMMRKAMIYAAHFDRVVISHCEDPTLIEGGAMNEGVVATELGLMGLPAVAEEIQVARELLLAEYLNTPVHLAHLSTARSVQLVREAKSRGVPVTCESCPQYWTLTEEAVRGYRTEAKMNPPLRTEADRLAVLEGYRDGTIDLIVTDHAPHHEDDKNCEFSLAKNGIIGLETSFALVYTHLVLPGVLSLMDAVARMTVKPARLLRQPEGALQPGNAANLTLVDLNRTFVYDQSKSASKADNTPFDGWELTGLPVLTIWQGRITHDGREDV